ncbi:MAG: S-adenosylmethionine decarboxylase [Chitinophagaceae bacterium]
MSYQPGMHIVAELHSEQTTVLSNFSSLKAFLDRAIPAYGLINLGEVYHNFNPGGFTAVICLSESHLSFHTWPEYSRVNMDIYLSNYQRNNDNTGQQLFAEIVEFFSATIIAQQQLKR